MTEAADLVAEVEARRAARKAALEEQRLTQRALDLEALDALEVEHGDSNVATLDVPYSPGLPTLVAVRCPTSPELKRYQARLRERNPNPITAAEEVARVCVVFPSSDDPTRATLLDARPGLLVQLGTLALGLATGRAAEEGKE
ncbi:MAG: hypothetical protein WC372_11550 [Candidatus Neomarinimicrobiota bacterium]